MIILELLTMIRQYPMFSNQSWLLDGLNVPQFVSKNSPYRFPHTVNCLIGQGLLGIRNRSNHNNLAGLGLVFPDSLAVLVLRSTIQVEQLNLLTLSAFVQVINLNGDFLLAFDFTNLGKHLETSFIVAKFEPCRIYRHIVDIDCPKGRKREVGDLLLTFVLRFALYDIEAVLVAFANCTPEDVHILTLRKTKNFTFLDRIGLKVKTRIFKILRIFNLMELCSIRSSGAENRHFHFNLFNVHFLFCFMVQLGTLVLVFYRKKMGGEPPILLN